MGCKLDLYIAAEEAKKLFPDEVSTPLEREPAVMSYLNRFQARFTSMRRAEVREYDGPYRRTLATIIFNTENGTVEVDDEEYQPEEQEAKRIKEALTPMKMPKSKPFGDDVLPSGVKELLKKDGTSLSVFRSAEGEVLMYAVRYDFDSGGKCFIPFTNWDDGQVRQQEPDGLLPLWGLENVQEATTAIIHEGTKAAMLWQAAVDGGEVPLTRNHPFEDALVRPEVVHIGWQGGAFRPQSSDWSSLKAAGIQRVIIVADNDDPGLSAVARISKGVGLPARVLQFDGRFPQSYDLADPIPADLWLSKESKIYVGPQFEDLLSSASWASRAYSPPGTGKTVYLPTAAFLADWDYLRDDVLFVDRNNPAVRLSPNQFDKQMRRYSDCQKVADLYLKRASRHVTSFCYEPGEPPGLISIDGQTSINVFQPPRLEPIHGGHEPFIKFMEYLFLNPEERHEVMRWTATLIAQPGTRMLYGMLLISSAQGTGKSTFMSRILAPLVGQQNVSHPNEKAILSDFNEWVGLKRLALVAEIYQGQGWKAYDMLKEVITDDKVTLNQKHLRPVTLNNHLHIVASSNSQNALKMDSDDRRWLVPQVTENPWPKKDFDELYGWLSGDGLNRILGWALDFGDYVKTGDRAPSTRMKSVMIEGSRSEHMQLALDQISRVADAQSPRSFGIRHLMDAVKATIHEKCYDKPADFKRAFRGKGWHEWGSRISVKGTVTYVMYNEAAKVVLEGVPSARGEELLREWLVDMSDSDAM